jgi:hypothetical protein
MSALKRIERTAARITARLDGRALKRVEEFANGYDIVAKAYARGTVYEIIELDARDLRAILALAKEAAELKRRIKLARRLLSPLGKRYGNPVDVPRWAIDRALDLRKPLKRGRR